MGAWIEINTLGIRNRGVKSHPTMGAWIEIVSVVHLLKVLLCRTPRWVRGLKFYKG